MANSIYHKTICEEMQKFAEDQKVIFLGQQVASEDFYGTLKNVSLSKRMEMPVAEELQMGLSIGLAMEGYLPISIYQRMDFIPRSADQLINHLNIMNSMTRGKFNPKVIIRTTIGSKTPFNVGPQHSQDLSDMCMSILHFPVAKVNTVEEVKEAYALARTINGPILIIESQELYYE